MKWLLLPIFLFAAAPTSVRAEDTVFDVAITLAYDRIFPDPFPGIRSDIKMSVTLSGRNTVSIERSRRLGRFFDRSRGITTLGGGNSRVQWRVVNSNSIQSIVSMPTSVRVITLSVVGENSCRVTVEERLKPGQSAYRYARRDGRGWANFSKPQLAASSCTVR